MLCPATGSHAGLVFVYQDNMEVPERTAPRKRELGVSVYFYRYGIQYVFPIN